MSKTAFIKLVGKRDIQLIIQQTDKYWYLYQMLSREVQRAESSQEDFLDKVTFELIPQNVNQCQLSGREAQARRAQQCKGPGAGKRHWELTSVAAHGD